MPINVGSNELGADTVYYGSNVVSEVYAGATKVWPSAPAGWWTGAGAVSAANVLEHESALTAAQDGAVAVARGNAWSIVFGTVGMTNPVAGAPYFGNCYDGSTVSAMLCLNNETQYRHILHQTSTYNLPPNGTNFVHGFGERGSGGGNAFSADRGNYYVKTGGNRGWGWTNVAGFAGFGGQYDQSSPLNHPYYYAVYNILLNESQYLAIRTELLNEMANYQTPYWWNGNGAIPDANVVEYGENTGRTLTNSFVAGNQPTSVFVAMQNIANPSYPAGNTPYYFSSNNYTDNIFMNARILSDDVTVEFSYGAGSEWQTPLAPNGSNVTLGFSAGATDTTWYYNTLSDTKPNLAAWGGWGNPPGGNFAAVGMTGFSSFPFPPEKRFWYAIYDTDLTEAQYTAVRDAVLLEM